MFVHSQLYIELSGEGEKKTSDTIASYFNCTTARVLTSRMWNIASKTVGVNGGAAAIVRQETHLAVVAP